MEILNAPLFYIFSNFFSAQQNYFKQLIIQDSKSHTRAHSFGAISVTRWKAKPTT